MKKELQFERYGERTSKANFHGMEILKLVHEDLGLLDFGIEIPIPKNEELILKYIHNMFSPWSKQQGKCPGGNFCLSGVIVSTPDDDLIITPFPCPPGSYCTQGSSSAIGAGFCPIGHYCPPGTQLPLQTIPGYFSPRTGAVAPLECYPGYYTIKYKSIYCKQCPSGHECKGTGTAWPAICQPGYYRNIMYSNVCLLCPEGTWNPERGSKDKSILYIYIYIYN